MDKWWLAQTGAEEIDESLAQMDAKHEMDIDMLYAQTGSDW